MLNVGKALGVVMLERLVEPLDRENLRILHGMVPIHNLDVVEVAKVFLVLVQRIVTF